MTNIVTIGDDRTARVRVNPDKAEIHGADLHLIPVLVPEFPSVALEYPIVLAKRGDTGQFTCSAMLGLELNENLFWQDDKWQGLYLPLQIRRQPFFVAEVEDPPAEDGQPLRQAICIDLDSPTVIFDENSPDGEALLTPDGGESEFLLRAKRILEQLLHGEQSNGQFIALLTELGLMQPLSMEITFVDDTSTRLEGMYTVDKEKLSDLPDDALLRLHKSGYLESLYAMTISLGQMFSLIHRKNQRISSG